MTTPTTAPAATLLPDDTTRLRAAAAFVRDQETPALLRLLLPGLDGPELRALADRCRFAHAALLVFPPDGPALRTLLTAAGLAGDPVTMPSVVVRDRLALRHGRDAAGLDVRILRPDVLCADGERRVVEVFALPAPPGSGLAELAAAERAAEHEAHLAFEVLRPDPLVLRGLCALFARYGALPDGGGYNPHEDGTVFYFTAPEESKAGYRRVELYAAGDHRDLLAPHLDAHRSRQPAETLLRLMTGAWTTQALAACAQLRLPEAMSGTAPSDGVPARAAADGTGRTAAGGGRPALDVAVLARAVGADPESLGTLLRYLAMVGVVEQDPGGRFRLTGSGALLRADAAGSMRSLALMYGGAFYQSFALLADAVRTGVTGFEQLFGENHFDYFARHPDLAERFDQSMAASARMFEPLPAHPVITAAAAGPGPRTVVDVAGGTGGLLGRILAARPQLRGLLLERAHVVEAARRQLDAAGVGDRCGYRTGDFADVPGGGDVYVLSRVLHDWDDDRCREILGHCARAMPEHADLLIVERLLPEDGSPSLATAWDLHMMCNVGGRERRLGHYAALLEDAGLRLVGSGPLPLGASVLHARRAESGPARHPGPPRQR
ncbi:methyltransferase [Streptomyces sp. NPDC097619]|uniref:methyltransferase n=1 Tax=Streptomyces sp. NPDC097619 TaxID=3157228 RepID=UPI003328788D